MTARGAVRLVTRSLTAVVLVGSGVYVMVYLYRWEWNRAVISGVFFLAAELALVSTALFARIGRLERRLDGAGAPPPPAPEPAADVSRESPFAWLDPASGRLGVFVPLLMGAGVILSAVAFLIEKVSTSVARAGSGPRLASRSVGPDLPAGGLLAEPAPPAPAERRRAGPPLAAAGLLLAAALLVPAVGLVADATQSRPDPHPDRTTLELDVWVRDARESATEEAGTLWVACRGRVSLDDVQVTATGPGRARLVVSGVMGEHARRRFTGCLQDATLDGVRAVLVATSTHPAP